MGQGESLNTIANRYNVPASAILTANGLANAGQVTAGRTVIIPVYNAVNATPVARPAAPVATAKPAPAQTTYRLVQGAKPAEAKAAETKNPVLADARRVVAEKKVAEEAPVRTRPGMAAVKPVEKVAEKPKAAEKTAPVQAAQVQPLKAAQPVEKAPEPKRQVAAVPVAPVQPVETAKPAPKEPESTASLPQQAAAPAPETDFRWPARGRVIQGFGGASGNEGINIAVPEGTPVKAAGDGTVAYAGEELKGYGKLVLIRHDNGYVSAYAHNGELNVKRGDKVKRGQAVAKSGQTGNVNAPQLHFEIRKGSTPVDPMPYLAN